MMNKINKLRNIIRKVIQEIKRITDKTWLTNDNELIKLEKNINHQDYLLDNTKYKDNKTAIKNGWIRSGNVNGVTFIRMKNLDKNFVDRVDRYIYDYYANHYSIFYNLADNNKMVRLYDSDINEERSMWKAVYKAMRMQQ